MKLFSASPFTLYSAFLLCSSVVMISGCIRSKPGEPEASSPTAPQAEVKQTTQLKEIEPGETFRVKFETSKGDFYLEVYSGWSPLGAARFKELVEIGFYDECRFFRNLPNFMVQWGINGDPTVHRKWKSRMIQDDPALQDNARGTISFAMSGPNTRTTQLFINYNNNTGSLNPQGFSPFGKVIQGMEVVDALNSEYRENPNQGRIQQDGNDYLNKSFPRLDYIIKATLLKADEEIPGDAKQPTEKPTETTPKQQPVTPSEPKKTEPANKPETIEEIK